MPILMLSPAMKSAETMALAPVTGHRLHKWIGPVMSWQSFSSPLLVRREKRRHTLSFVFVVVVHSDWLVVTVAFAATPIAKVVLLLSIELSCCRELFIALVFSRLAPPMTGSVYSRAAAFLRQQRISSADVHAHLLQGDGAAIRETLQNACQRVLEDMLTQSKVAKHLTFELPSPAVQDVTMLLWSYPKTR